MGLANWLTLLRILLIPVFVTLSSTVGRAWP
jgi:phosphatidylglycerophosphate synthase